MTQALKNRLSELWERYRPLTVERMATLETAVRLAKAGALTEEQREGARREAHKLAGTLGTFGMMDGTRLARAVEAMLAGEAGNGPDPLRLADLVASLQREIGRPRSRLLAEPEGPQDLPTVLIVDPDPVFARRVAVEVHARRMRAQIAADADGARQLMAEGHPQAAVLNLPFTGEEEPGLALLKELGGAAVVVVTESRAFSARVTAARRGVCGFFQKPAAPAAVVEALQQAMQRERAIEATVLVVDDDEQMLALVRTLLEPQGLRTVTVADPVRFWEALEEAEPDLIVMDMEMPGLNGVDLCRVVRADSRWRTTPVLFLTGRTDEGTIHQVFAAGADDFVTKPVVGPELTTRIANRLERTQLHRHLAETDVLTGVANRRKSAQVLEHFIRLAARQQQPLSLAVVDVDHFKQVNDTYGHAAGDMVLRHMGELLLRSFRGEDVVARWGGEEFVIGMYTMSKEDAVNRITRLLDQLRREAFTAPDGSTFTVTLSVGVAQYPLDGGDLQGLYRAADEAMYRIKVAGRNGVIGA